MKENILLWCRAWVYAVLVVSAGLFVLAIGARVGFDSATQSVPRHQAMLAPEPAKPARQKPDVFERGSASWYGIDFHQRTTASGELFDMNAYTAAHRTLPFNTHVCVRSLATGRKVLVRINDRGLLVPGRIIDLSRAAADAIGLTKRGIGKVALSIVDPENIDCNGTQVAQAPSAAQSQPDLQPDTQPDYGGR